VKFWYNFDVILGGNITRNSSEWDSERELY